MKRTAVCLVVAVLAFLAGTMLVPVVAAPKEKEHNGKFDTIEAKTIKLTSGDGKHTIVLAAQDDSVGMWVTDHRRDGRFVTVMSQERIGPWVGFSDHKGIGCPLALSWGDDGFVVQRKMKGKDFDFRDLK